MKRLYILLFLFACDPDPLPATAVCRDMQQASDAFNHTCPHPAQRLEAVLVAGDGCNPGRTIVFCKCSTEVQDGGAQ